VFLEEIIMGNNSNLEKKEQNIRPKNLWLEKRNKILVREQFMTTKRCQIFRLRNKLQLQIREKKLVHKKIHYYKKEIKKLVRETN
jgi:hypothetical protein